MVSVHIDVRSIRRRIFNAGRVLVLRRFIENKHSTKI